MKILIYIDKETAEETAELNLCDTYSISENLSILMDSLDKVEVFSNEEKAKRLNELDMLIKKIDALGQKMQQK